MHEQLHVPRDKSFITKTFNQMVFDRIPPVLDPLLRTAQNGFRQERSTVGHIIVLRRIIEGVKHKHLSAVITFIDFRKEFDTLHRVNILTAYVIPNKLVQVIGVTYASTRARVTSPDGVTEFFDILTGVLQGDTLAPFLFVIVLDYALRKAIDSREEELGFTLVPRKSRQVSPVTITDMNFADDIALISNTVEQAQELLLSVEECLKVGLQLNTKKTKALGYNINDTSVRTRDVTALKVKSDLKYLGAWINSSDKDLKTRRRQVWSVLYNMKKVWSSAVLLYGAETWTLTTKMEKSLDGCYTRMLSMALNISWQDHMRNVDLYAGMP